jgi:hypothetical protein
LAPFATEPVEKSMAINRKITELESGNYGSPIFIYGAINCKITGSKLENYSSSIFRTLVLERGSAAPWPQ